jgi:antibiotic biosynthesis monooxygenase (ABM) superfamily enzyme
VAQPSHPIPTVHERALITWLAIFPLVAIGLSVLGGLLGDAHPILKAFILTLIVVPLAVYVVVPQLMKVYFRIKKALSTKKEGPSS